jgi:hypothetical protein
MVQRAVLWFIQPLINPIGLATRIGDGAAEAASA